MLKSKYVFLILFAGLLFSSCEKKDNSVIDPTLNFPSITSASIDPSVVDTNIVQVAAFVHVTSVDPIASVSATVTSPINTSEGVYLLRNDGTPPDSVAGDEIYSGYIAFTMDCRLVGAHKTEFIAKTVSNLQSNNVIMFLNVVNTHNHPPVVSNLFIDPKDILFGSEVNLHFRLNVSDPDGQCDINSVFYTGHDPNGTGLTLRHLFDDGNCCLVEGTTFTSGDSVANDGIFTRRFPPASPTYLGYYVYHLRAVDNSHDTSNVISDSIYVHQ